MAGNADALPMVVQCARTSPSPASRVNPGPNHATQRIAPGIGVFYFELNILMRSLAPREQLTLWTRGGSLTRAPSRAPAPFIPPPEWRRGTADASPARPAGPLGRI